MALAFDEFIDLAPIPTSPARAAREAAVVQRRLAEVGGVDEVRAEALAAIYDASPDDEPGEKKRLRLLYRDAYTEDELAAFVAGGLARLGFDE